MHFPFHRSSKCLLHLLKIIILPKCGSFWGNPGSICLQFTGKLERNHFWTFSIIMSELKRIKFNRYLAIWLASYTLLLKSFPLLATDSSQYETSLAERRDWFSPRRRLLSSTLAWSLTSWLSRMLGRGCCGFLLQYLLTSNAATTTRTTPATDTPATTSGFFPFAPRIHRWKRKY